MINDGATMKFKININIQLSDTKLSKHELKEAIINYIGAGNMNMILGGSVDDLHVEAIDPDAKYILYATGEMNEQLELLYEVYTEGGALSGELACIDQITLEDATLNVTHGNHTIIE